MGETWRDDEPHARPDRDQAPPHDNRLTAAVDDPEDRVVVAMPWDQPAARDPGHALCRAANPMSTLEHGGILAARGRKQSEKHHAGRAHSHGVLGVLGNDLKIARPIGTLDAVKSECASAGEYEMLLDLARVTMRRHQRVGCDEQRAS